VEFLASGVPVAERSLCMLCSELSLPFFSDCSKNLQKDLWLIRKEEVPSASLAFLEFPPVTEDSVSGRSLRTLDSIALD